MRVYFFDQYGTMALKIIPMLSFRNLFNIFSKSRLETKDFYLLAEQIYKFIVLNEMDEILCCNLLFQDKPNKQHNLLPGWRRRN